MRDGYQTAFIDRVIQMDDDALLKTLVRMTAAPGEYQPEAIAAARDEVARRRLTPAQQRDALHRAKQEALDALRDDAMDLALEGRDIATIEEHLPGRRGSPSVLPRREPADSLTE